MEKIYRVLAIDIGASSGRFFIVEYKDDQFSVKETFRFANGMKNIDGHLRWDFHEIMEFIEKGLKVTLSNNKDIDCFGIDTWGVDYCLLNSKGKIIDNPIAYRDPRNNYSAKKLLSLVNYDFIYNETGVQFLPFNTIFQLYKDIQNNIEYDKILLIPDAISYFLTGEKYIELTNFSTTALYNPRTRQISKKCLDLIKFDIDKLPKIIYPSNKVGVLADHITKKLGVYSLPLVSVGSHDTASAVAGVPLDKNSAYLISGTWSLLGVELNDALINEKTIEYNFTNEVGLEGKIRFLKNIMGMFIIQNVRKSYLKKYKDITFQKMQDEATKVKENDFYINVNDILFSNPRKDMLSSVYLYLKKTNQTEKELELGHICRIIYESIAFNYVSEFQKLCELTNNTYSKLIIVGGGSKSKLLNQLIANSLNVNIEIGQAESAVYGNAIAQLIYLGVFKDLEEGRRVLKNSSLYQVFKPKNITKYKKKYSNYKKILNEGGRKNVH